MATTITTDCINCGACEPECPNNAISQGDPIYIIDPKLCTECVGFHDFEACAAVCPVDCCVTDPQNIEPESVLIERARALHPGTDFGENFPSRFRKADGEQQTTAAAASAEAEPKTDPSAQPAPAAATQTEPAKAAPAEAKSAPVGTPSASAGVEEKPTPAAEAKAPPAKPATPVAGKAPAAQPAVKTVAPPKQEVQPKKVFPNELPVAFEEISKQYTSGGSLNDGLAKWLVILAQPALGALPDKTKRALEAAVRSPLFTAAGSTGLNIVHNAVLYPLVCMAIAALLQGPSIFFSQAINSYIFLGILLAAAEAVYRLKDGIFGLKSADEMNLRPAIYGGALELVVRPLVEKRIGLVRATPVPFDGFYSSGFVEKLERERRYGNAYTIEDRGGALLLRMEFPRSMPDTGLSFASPLPSEMPDYDYDLALQNGEFVVKGRCADERVRKISSSIGAFPPEFMTVIPLRERVTGFAHRCENKLLEVLLVKENGSRWSENHH